MFRLFWNDPSLAFERQRLVSKIMPGAGILEKIWLPDIFIVDELDRPYSGPATNTNTLVRILPSGDVLWSRKRAVRVGLKHEAGTFYLAPLEIESFGQTMSDIVLRWEDGLNSVKVQTENSFFYF